MHSVQHGWAILAKDMLYVPYSGLIIANVAIFIHHVEKFEIISNSSLSCISKSGSHTCNVDVLTRTLLTHWGRVTHICVSKQTIIGSDNGLSPGRRQAIIRTNAGILLIGPLGTNFSEILVEIRIFSFKKMGLKVSSAKWRPFCLGLNVLNKWNSPGPILLILVNFDPNIAR